ncbi:Phox/Bem1p [Cynara cardunculus var. scolymus]|uniref:Phox/Bem1p n=1 Tax=Cynara cardunculus var. scolymus TaxID=59895 RepID=A0A124SEH3_CYNCS|nr:Phox/Bem1p [Cynara cardunculus var. scolymus]
MDPPPTTAATTAVEPPHSHSHTHCLPPLPTPKIRLMCSYGGHIVPRPQTKSLCYAGGETRIVAVDRRTTASTISALTHHLSRTLYGNRPFTLKYQLPNEDLDSLISITTDEDLQNMLEEHDRIATSPTPSRIRLFLFPTRPESVGSLLLDPKSESWFSDALKSTMIINRGLSDGSGMGNGLMGLDCLEGNGESLMNSGDSGKCGGTGGDSGSVPESMVLETCSSFGSINSSVSASNLPPIGVNNEDGGSNLVERKVKVVAPESIIYNPSSTIQMQKTVQVPGYPMPHIPDQRQHPVQYIHTGSPHYIQYPTGPLPISSYYPMYMPYQQQPNQPYPIYVMPVGPTDQSYNISAPSDVNGSVTGSLRRPPLPTHIANSHVAYKEVTLSQPIPERAAPSNRVPSVQPVGPTATTTPTYENDYDNDLAYAQIYKSQPSAPAFPPPKYETVAKAGVVLSDPSTPLQIGTPQQ